MRLQLETLGLIDAALRRMLGEGKMRPGVVVIGGIRRKNPARVTDFQFWPSIPTRLMGISAGIIG